MTIQDPKKQQEFYQALLKRDPQYLGLFFVGVTTTGVFCVSTCRARKPKKENTEFFSHIHDAILHGYRPCKICNPTSTSFETPDSVIRLLEQLKKQPGQKIQDYQLRQQGISPEVMRRWFQKHYGMTFHGYQRMLRINTAMKELTNGKKIIDVAFDLGYESLSGFSSSYKKLIGGSPSRIVEQEPLVLKRINTLLGPMFLGASQSGLCLLEFVDRRMLETEFKELQHFYKTTIIAGENRYTLQAERELSEYFAGTRKTFLVKLDTPGTSFQQLVWENLQRIPYGNTCSYEEIATTLGSKESVRAVGTANGHNRVAIIIPCHRVIRKDGSLGGYGGGLERKKWLLNFERENMYDK